MAREFGAYLVASAAALAIDMAVLLFLAHYIHYLVAATLSFITGMLVCYGLTVRYVFSIRRYRGDLEREAFLFFLTGLAGLAINDFIIFVAISWWSTSLIIAKMSAAAVSFMFNFCGRKWLLF